MTYNKVLTIQDISCVGQCSLTVALPILSACGQETCILPSAVLSTHTAGFHDYTFRDLTDDIPFISEHWKKENIKFDCIYTGYLGSTKQIDYVKDILNTLGTKQCLKVIDPAMADNGSLYPAFDQCYVEAMKELCKNADILLPNITEACFLAGYPYLENYRQEDIETLLKELSKLCNKTIVLTGVSYREGCTGIVVYQNAQMNYYEHKKFEKGCHGTGDVYAASFVGALMNQKTVYEAAKIAGDYTYKCIENTQGDASHWYGVKFETALLDLIEMVK